MSIADTYIKKINELLKDCNDIELIDFIYQLLQKRCKQLPDT